MKKIGFCFDSVIEFTSKYSVYNQDEDIHFSEGPSIIML